ncbi:MAG: hypothetical protein JSW71_21760 [Gemmatimonadota bacterium]|nr:MAG: hypothetical protein JSW71_21760 [Gemmatimonadota bacterium]
MDPFNQLVAIVFGTAVALALVGVKAYAIWAGRRASNLDARRIEELEGRVAELEERADFAERLLTEERHQGQIPSAADTPV